MQLGGESPRALLPGQELFYLMPNEVRTLVLGSMVFSRLETGRLQDALLADGMARALHTANAEVEDSLLSGRPDWTRRFQRVGDWLRETTEHAQEEGTFGEVLRHYSQALAEQSFEAVGDELEELPSSLVFRLNERLPELLEDQPLMPSPEGELHAAGTFLGMGLHQLYLATLAFGLDRGLFQARDFGVDGRQVDSYGTSASSRNGSFVIVDADHLASLRLFEGIVHNIRQEWGAVHPLVRGFRSVLGAESWLDPWGNHRLRPAADEVEAFLLSPRH